ncbi:MAG TPA: DUF2071 domain-containing protein [Candidatus Angelobacter sp.]|nr:DUF2071 domain-containing protein [Candidatus Angelobacter sp.]
MQQTWNDLLFAHWPINPDVMRPLIPSVLALDTFNGECWIAVTPFHMSGIRARFMPRLPGLSAFPELNVRTYVNYRGKPGVYFFSLDAGSRVAAWTARLTYHLPYFNARMSSIDREGWIHYHSIRDSGAELKGRFRPVAPVQLRNPATLEHWLSERYCLYAMHHGRVYRAEIHHEPWPLQDAECEFSINSMATSAGIQLPPIKPLAHFAKRLEVLIWPLKRA